MSQKICVGDIFQTNKSGEIIVISYVNCYEIGIMFLDTGFKRSARSGDIRRGRVRDPYAKTLYGVGYIGEGIYIPQNNKILSKSYTCWKAMIERCYYSEFQKNNTTYIGCKVCPEWHNYQNFAKWFEENYIEGYHLDKDIGSTDQKVYSPETCVFVTQKENNCQAVREKTEEFVLIASDGKKYKGTIKKEFADRFGLCPRRVGELISGRINNYAGWVRDE